MYYLQLLFLVTDVSEFLVKQMSGLFHHHDIEFWQVGQNFYIEFWQVIQTYCLLLTLGMGNRRRYSHYLLPKVPDNLEVKCSVSA